MAAVPQTRAQTTAEASIANRQVINPATLSYAPQLPSLDSSITKQSSELTVTMIESAMGPMDCAH